MAPAEAKDSSGRQARLLLQAPARLCSLISLRPTRLHTLGTLQVGVPGEEASSKKGKRRCCTAYEHPPAGSRGCSWTGGVSGLSGVPVRRLMATPCFSGDKSMVLIRVRQFQMLCWRRRRQGEATDRRDSKNWQKLHVKLLYNFHYVFQLITFYKVYAGLCVGTRVWVEGVREKMNFWAAPSVLARAIPATVQCGGRTYILLGNPIHNPDGTATIPLHLNPRQVVLTHEHRPGTTLLVSPSSFALLGFLWIIRGRSKWQPAKSSSISVAGITCLSSTC